MVAYIRFRATELPRSVGIDAPGGRRRSDGRAGHLCHGPYVTLVPGRYAAGFFVRRELDHDEGEVEIEAVTAQGLRVLARRNVPVRDLFASLPGLIDLHLTIDAVERGCELRLFVPARSAIELSEVVLFRTDFAARRVA